MTNETRIDKWLWAVRLFKTRTLAATACRNSQVKIGDQTVKASRDVRVGDVIRVKVGGVQRTVKVVGFPASRVGSKMVAEFLEDLTPEAEYAKARADAALPRFQWEKGAGRPTKKNRRLWEQFGDAGSDAAGEGETTP